MTQKEFLDSPWRQSHPLFSEAVFSLYRAPEFSTGEVLLSSLYRASGFATVKESRVKSLGEALSKAADKQRKKEAQQGEIQPDTWRTVLDRLVQSPKVAKQSSKRFMSLSPVIPDAALYSGAARLAGNPWNPGELVKRMIQLGGASDDEASGTWEALHEALTVREDDDVWARWLQGQFDQRRPADINWARTDMAALGMFPATERSSFAYPAKQFVADVNGIIAAKAAMTRRQWISLLEAVLRIGTVSHVLWVCDVNDRIWRLVRQLIEADLTPLPSNDAEVTEQLFAVKNRMLSFGHPAIPTLRDHASRYLSARLGLNCVLWTLEDLGIKVARLDSISGVRNLLEGIKANSESLRTAGVLDTYHKLQDREVRTVACKKGVGSNLMEFAQYTLGQRQTMDETLRGYDQGYFLRKRSESRNSPWVLALGPAAVLAMAHCCLHEVNGPRSVQRLAKHLSSYGIEFDMHGLNESDLGRQLRMLGLVLDSPDAESGMLLVPPFAYT